MRRAISLRSVLVVLVALIYSTAAEAKGTGTVHVRSYTRKDGTFVHAHTRSAPRTTARSAAPSGRTVEARTYEPRTLDPAFEPTPPKVDRSKRPSTPVEPDTDPKDDARAQKLLDFAKREYALGKIENGVNWLRRIIKNYKPTTAATEANLLLEDWKQNEPFRTWSDVTGKFSTEAKFIRFDKGTVYLETRNGKTISLDIKRLCRSDQEYVMNREGI